MFVNFILGVGQMIRERAHGTSYEHEQERIGRRQFKKKISRS